MALCHMEAGKTLQDSIDEIREAVSNHVEGIDYGKGSRLRDKVKTWSLNKMDSHDSFNLK